MRAALALRILSSCLALIAVSREAFAQSPLSISDGIESARAIATPTDRPDPVFVSPDGQRYVLMIVRGDIARDRVVLEIMMGGLQNLSVARPSVIKRLYTTGLGYAHGEGMPAGAPLLTSVANLPTWIDRERIVFLWDDASGANQLVLLNTTTRELTYLTHET